MSDPDINKLDKTIAVIEQKIDDGFKQNFKEHSEIFEYIKDIEAKKADKYIVDELKSNQNKVVWLIVSTVLVAIIGLVITKY
jgi:hypothetical protein